MGGLMDRRSFLAFSTGSLALNAFDAPPVRELAGQKGLKLSTTWWLVSKLPVPDALALLTRLGYDGYEMFDWRDPKVMDIFVSLKDKYPLSCECLVANKGVTAPGCGLVNPREREEFLKQTQLAIDAARAVGAKQLMTLTGNEMGGVPRSEQMANAVTALRAAAPMLEKSGMTAIVEVLNTYVDHAGYFLYNVQIMEGNLIENIRNNIDRIGHFHVGDVPGRHQPGTGEINYRNVFKAIYDQGDRFQGSVALEYSPTVPLEQDLATMRALANFGVIGQQ